MKNVLGTKIEKTDELSRRPDWKVDIENNNSNQVFIKDHWICNLSEVVISNKRTRRRDIRKNKNS